MHVMTSDRSIIGEKGRGGEGKLNQLCSYGSYIQPSFLSPLHCLTKFPTFSVRFISFLFFSCLFYSIPSLFILLSDSTLPAPLISSVSDYLCLSVQNNVSMHSFYLTSYRISLGTGSPLDLLSAAAADKSLIFLRAIPH